MYLNDKSIERSIVFDTVTTFERLFSLTLYNYTLKFTRVFKVRIIFLCTKTKLNCLFYYNFFFSALRACHMLAPLSQPYKEDCVLAGVLKDHGNLHIKNY